ncbi:hypothetical protein pb186bvf_018775 [Paramecium bursaria]
MPPQYRDSHSLEIQQICIQKSLNLIIQFINRRLFIRLPKLIKLVKYFDYQSPLQNNLYYYSNYYKNYTVCVQYGNYLKFTSNKKIKYGQLYDHRITVYFSCDPYGQSHDCLLIVQQIYGKRAIISKHTQFQVLNNIHLNLIEICFDQIFFKRENFMKIKQKLIVNLNIVKIQSDYIIFTLNLSLLGFPILEFIIRFHISLNIQKPNSKDNKLLRQLYGVGLLTQYKHRHNVNIKIQYQ